MKLVEFDGMDFKIADEAFLIKPIRDLLKADKSRKKEEFWKQISYLWFMCDPRSSYMYILDENSRSAEIILQEGLGSKWKPSVTLLEAMEVYKRMSTTTNSKLLESMRKGIENVRVFLETVDLSAVDAKTLKPIYQVSTITSALKQIPDLAKALSDAEKALEKDFADEGKVRGTTSRSAGEDL